MMEEKAMAYGDVGGVETWRTVTFKTPDSGTISIQKGDAVSAVGDYRVNNDFTAEDIVFGQAMGSAEDTGQLIPVKVRGIAQFEFTGVSPVVDGLAGVLASDTNGSVKKPASGNGVGRNLNVEITSQTLTLATVLNGESVTINGLTFTGHADTTTPANREFAIDGTDTQDAAELAGLINDATYGVPGATATAASDVVTVTADDPQTTTISVTNPASTITVAVAGGNVQVLL